MIPAKLAAKFPAGVRSRGEAYAARKRVRIVAAGRDAIAAVVRGTSEYLVDVNAYPGSLVVECTCPYAIDNGACKHGWAVLRQTDTDGTLSAVLTSAGSNPVFRCEAGLDESEDADLDGDAEHADWYDSPSPNAHRQATTRPRRPPPQWKRVFDSAQRQMRYVDPARPRAAATWPNERRLIYIVDLDATSYGDGVVVHIGTERRKKDGTWDAPKGFALGVGVWSAAPDPLDRQIAQMLLGALPTNPYGATRTSGFVIKQRALDSTLRAICESGRCRVRMGGQYLPDALRWDDGAPWHFRLRVVHRPEGGYALAGVLGRDGGEMSLQDPLLLHNEGFLFTRAAVARFDHGGAFPLVAELRGAPVLALEKDALPEVLEALHSLPNTPGIELPPDAALSAARMEPVPCVSIGADPEPWRARGAAVTVSLGFRYGELRVATDEGKNALFDRDRGILYHRDRSREAAARERLTALGVNEEWDYGAARKRLTVRRSKLTSLVLEWLERLGPLAATGVSEHGITRFRRPQVALLDALLATLPEVSVDDTFERARAEVRRFDRVQAAAAPATFNGTLREYQSEGLGWLHFLRRFGLGGCLADDMGLGKTVQVLALLDSRRLEHAGPSIVVVPRSLVFNWMREAERFTPALRVLDYSGSGRDAAAINPKAVDVVLTTYGTLRRDAASLAAIEFEYAVLDEAQTIKNAGTASAKAARLLRARHRLALSGTPIENRIDELWSLFEFLNPGMLGAKSHFSSLARLASATAEASHERSSLGNGRHDPGRELLARALRPVILRRTKEKVASELPPRMEQTLEVELQAPQRKFYEGLRAAYRRSVLARVDRDGIKRSRMHILEALLRLRQAACHPVLADRRQARLPSAKLDALLPALGEVAAEGHKALVFSQFTTFLALVRQRLEKERIGYEYLDGEVRDRQSRVDRFQSDANCPVFLISLRAGGHGLNLTAADYVFILDPWWNPAVEAQAIDRTHRIGQTRRVIATRLVARSTIEEKILELQAAKRSLADAILSADAGVLSAIGREELELLLGRSGR